MERKRDRDGETFGWRDDEIIYSLRMGRNLDGIFDEAHLQGFDYELEDLNRLRNLAKKRGHFDLLEKIPGSNLTTRQNMLEQLRQARERYGNRRVIKRMGMENNYFLWDSLRKFEEGDATIFFARKICFALGLSLKELMSDE